MKSVNSRPALQQPAVKQIALLGGTFDPFHNGHLRMAIELRLAGFDQVCIIPNAVPPHRPQPQASGQHRLAMIEHAVLDLQGIDADPCELLRQGESYSILTLQEKRQQLTPDTGITWVMGDDAFVGLHTWHQAEQMMMLANVLVVSRGQEKQFESGTLQDNWLQESSTDLQSLLKCHKGSVCRMNWPFLDISATRVRQLLTAQQGPTTELGFTRENAVQGLIPNPSLNYLIQHSLYRSDN